MIGRCKGGLIFQPKANVGQEHIGSPRQLQVSMSLLPGGKDLIR